MLSNFLETQKDKIVDQLTRIDDSTLKTLLVTYLSEHDDPQIEVEFRWDRGRYVIRSIRWISEQK